MSEWRTIDSAPKDGTAVLFFGRWKGFDIVPGGEPHIGIYSWSTFMSDGTGHQWIGEGLSTMSNTNVEYTHWMPLPPPPSPETE